MFDSFTDFSCKLAGTGSFIDLKMIQLVFLAAKLQNSLLLRNAALSDRSYECRSLSGRRSIKPINMTQHAYELKSIPIPHCAAEQRSFPKPQLEIESRMIPMTQCADGSRSIPMTHSADEQSSVPAA